MKHVFDLTLVIILAAILSACGREGAQPMYPGEAAKQAACAGTMMRFYGTYDCSVDGYRCVTEVNGQMFIDDLPAPDCIKR